jgi:hypothetical protein
MKTRRFPVAWICAVSLAVASAYGCSAKSGGGVDFGGQNDDTGDDAAPALATGNDGGGGVTYAEAGGGASSNARPGDAGNALQITTSDAAPTEDPDVAYSVTLTSQSFTVPPNTEAFKCQDFENPFNGQQVDIKTWEDDMTVGSHHMFVFYKAGASDSAISDCSGLESGPFTFVAQGPHVVQTYPEGIGATIPTSIGFHLNIHYINTASTPLTAQVKVTMSVWKSGRVTNHAGMIFDNNLNVTVPADGKTHTYTATCAVPQDVYVLASNSHMHSEATNFVATAGGMPLYQTVQWSDPPETIFSPPMHLAAGTPITWTCTYVNSGKSTLTFGETAGSNVMCISQSMFYPVSDVTNPTIGCSTAGTSD